MEEEALLKKTARIIHSLRGPFKLNDILVVVGFPKATYMYWQKRFDRVNPNQELEEKIIAIRKEHKDYGYRRIHAVLRKQGFNVNKKRVQRIIQKLGLQSYIVYNTKSVNTVRIKAMLQSGTNRIHRRI